LNGLTGLDVQQASLKKDAPRLIDNTFVPSLSDQNSEVPVRTLKSGPDQASSPPLPLNVTAALDRISPLWGDTGNSEASTLSEEQKCMWWKHFRLDALLVQALQRCLKVHGGWGN